MNNAREITIRLLDLLRREQSAMADFLVALADFDRRRLWQGGGPAALLPHVQEGGEGGLGRAPAAGGRTAPAGRDGAAAGTRPP